MLLFPGILITSPKPDHEPTDISAELFISASLPTCHRPVSKREACWTDAERQALPLPECRRAASLPSCIFSSLTNKTANYFGGQTLAIKHTLYSSVSETIGCPLGAVTEMVHCPAAAAAAAAAADPSREQTDRPPASTPPLLHSAPPSFSSPSSSSHHISFIHPAFSSVFRLFSIPFQKLTFSPLQVHHHWVGSVASLQR